MARQVCRPRRRANGRGGRFALLAGRTQGVSKWLRSWSCPAVELYQDQGGVRHYAEQAKAPNTWRAYEADWADFTWWCETRHEDVLPAEPRTIASYLAYLAKEAGAKVSTAQRRIADISHAHRAAGYDPPPDPEI